MIEEYLTIRNLIMAAFLLMAGYIGFLKIRKLLNEGLPTSEGADAQRFAKLLATEIKLYGEDKVSRGLAGNDLYDSLRDEIEKARKTFSRQITDPSQMRYLDDALVEILADGDRNKMGENYASRSMF